MKAKTINKEEIPRLLTIRQMADKHPFMSESSIRWLIIKNPPGLEECLVRVSRRVFIDESKYFKFLKTQSSSGLKKDTTS